MTMSLRTGAEAQIGPYQLMARIGEGGMGTVYLARMAGGLQGVNKLAVVKVLRADLLGSPDFVAMFLDEARLAARLTHPNVVHTYGADDDSGRLYIAMEHLDGQPWARVRHRLWANRTLPLAMHLKVLADTLAGLHYAHELTDFSGESLEVVHCDMSPQNVFVTYDGQVKVVDFGVARAAHFSRSLRPDLFFGKLSYCAPEQARGEVVDRRADVFSVGVMLWEALTGRRFASGNDTSEMRRVRVAGSEPRAREVAPRIPRILGDICDRALATDPAERFATAAEFREQLLAYLAGHWRDSDGQQLGALVAEAFEQERGRVYTLVKRRLADPDASAPVEDLLDDSEGSLLGENTMPVDLTELASVSRSAEGGLPMEVSEKLTRISEGHPIEPAPAPTSRASVWPLLLGLVFLAAAVAGAWFFFLAPGRGPQRGAQAVGATAAGEAQAVGGSVAGKTGVAGPAAAPADSEAGEATAAGERGSASAQAPAGESRAAGREPGAEEAAEEGAKVELVLSADPLDAVLTLDGETLPTNPYVAKPTADDAVHTLTASAEGYKSRSREVRFDRDQIVKLKLFRAWSRKRSASARRNERSPAPQEEATEAQAAEKPAEEEPAQEQASEAKAKPAADKPKSDSRTIYDEVPF